VIGGTEQGKQKFLKPARSAAELNLKQTSYQRVFIEKLCRELLFIKFLGFDAADAHLLTSLAVSFLSCNFNVVQFR